MDKRKLLNLKRFFKVKKLKAIEYKGGKCQKCGYDKCISALEFHHRDPSEKEFEWGKMRSTKWEKVLEELDKCDLLCANCHREEHFDNEIWEEAAAWGLLTDEQKKKLVPNNGKNKTKRPKALGHCKNCGCEFFKHTTSTKFCSLSCSSQANRKTQINWPDDLPEMVARSSMKAVARQLGVSDKAVAKRLKKHH